MKEGKTSHLVIDGNLHVQCEDGYYRRIPLGMDDARMKEDHPVYRVEDGQPVKVEPADMDFAEAVANISMGGSTMDR